MSVPQLDITGKEDLELLMRAFYSEALNDPVIGSFFELVHLDLESHLPRIVSFWETTLLHKASYKGNPMALHLQLNRLQSLQSHHFDRWLQLFGDKVDEHFVGENADQIKSIAHNIGTLMQVKISRDS